MGNPGLTDCLLWRRRYTPAVHHTAISVYLAWHLR